MIHFLTKNVHCNIFTIKRDTIRRFFSYMQFCVRLVTALLCYSNKGKVNSEKIRPRASAAPGRITIENNLLLKTTAI